MTVLNQHENDSILQIFRKALWATEQYDTFNKLSGLELRFWGDTSELVVAVWWLYNLQEIFNVQQN